MRYHMCAASKLQGLNGQPVEGALHPLQIPGLRSAPLVDQGSTHEGVLQT